MDMPSTGLQNSQKPHLYLKDLNQFYKERNSKYQNQLPTEGDVFYSSKIGLLTKNQTVSMLNTPFFTNAIQESIDKFRNFDEYPYTVPAYLFLNSLPLATLRERYTLYSKTLSPDSQEEIDNVEYMNYIFATLKKFGAIHKISLPWVLKIGSIWHRYKKWVETGVDILDNSWKPFPYLENFDPISSASTVDYALTLENNQNIDIILQKDSTVGTQTYTQISTGFYPETINDFNVFYQGFRLFTGYTSSDIQSGITSGLRLVNSEDSNVTVGFSASTIDPERYIQLNAWSVYVLTPDKKDCFILPSHGALINQVKSECFREDVNIRPIPNNDYVFDGSVRSFWCAPNYGYFSTDKIVKPNPDEYLKKVFGGFKTQENFSFRSSTTGYTNISEMFSVFERGVLDEFEKKFLSFSLPKYNYEDIDSEFTSSENSYGNFHLLFTKLMKIPAPPTGLTANLTIKALQTSQIQQFKKTIQGFLNHEVLIKYGNPSNFDKKLFYSFSSKFIQDPYIFEKYTFRTPNALPSSAGTQTLIGSKLSYSGAWESLLLNVGFSDVQGIAYSNTGCTIFDFFIDNNIAFTEENVKLLSPIIKIYATKKYENPSLTPDDFIRQMDEYLDRGTKFIDKSISNLFTQLRKKLSGIKIVKEREIVSKLEGSQTKLELYQSFKATNDKWISGNDFKTKTLFEDVLLLDSASRNVGDVAVVDIYHLRNLFNPEDMNLTNSMYVIVNTILSHNKFTVFNIPAYVNFYNVQDATKDATPKPDGSLELANSLFGTFLDVDYRNSSTKMVGFYPGEPSAHLDTQGVIQGWNDDAFDMRRPANNPLIEDQINKRDYDKSNKVIGFNVDIGPQNQGVFNTFSVSQKNGTSTAESLQMLSEMSRQAGNRNVATQNLSLYNLYKVRSYDCNVTMMGDAMIQPLMWFNLRYVPMFSGPYMIFEVTHNISPGTFTTSFTGVRQAIKGPPRQLDFLQSLRTNLLEKILAKKREDIEKQKQADSKNVLNDRQSIVQNSEGTNSPSNSSECSGVTAYATYTKLKNEPKAFTSTIEATKKAIKQVGTNIGIPQQTIDKLQYAIFAQMYLQGGSETSITGLEKNFIGLDLNSNWGKDPSEKFFGKPNEYFCVKRNEVITPFVRFDSIEKNIEFLYSRWEKRVAALTDTSAEKIAIFINTNLKPNGASPSNWFSLPKDAKDKIITKVQKSIDLYNASR